MVIIRTSLVTQGISVSAIPPEGTSSPLLHLFRKRFPRLLTSGLSKFPFAGYW